MGKINLHVSRIPPSRATKLQIWVGRRWVGRSTFLSTVPSLPAVAYSSELHREKERENSLSSVTKAAGMAISGSPVALLFPWGTRLSQALWFSYVGEQVIQPPGLMLLVTNGVVNIFFKKKLAPHVPQFEWGTLLLRLSLGEMQCKLSDGTFFWLPCIILSLQGLT